MSADAKLVVEAASESLSNTYSPTTGRFIRPARIRIRGRNLRLGAEPVVFNPDAMVDFYPIPESMHGSGSMRQAFDNGYDTFQFFQNDPPSIGHPLLSIQTGFLLWRQLVRSIVSGLDVGVPLARVLCLTLGGSPAVDADSSSISEDAAAFGVVMDIVAVKRYNSTGTSTGTGTGTSTGIPTPTATPVIFVRYAAIDNSPVVPEAILDAASDLPSGGAHQKTFFCTRGEIVWALHTLAAQAGCVDEAYRQRWEASSPHNSSQRQLFMLSCLRPTDEPMRPTTEAEESRRLEQALQKEARAAARMIKEGQIAFGKEVSKQDTAERRQREETERARRIAEIYPSLATGEVAGRWCHKAGCTEFALLQCGRCRTTHYCGRRRELS